MSFPGRKYTAVDLVAGSTYRVMKAFTDYDGIRHEVGESWRFISKNFLPYDDGLTLDVEMNGKTVSIRMQWRDESQGQIIDDFSDYVEELP